MLLLLFVAFGVTRSNPFHHILHVPCGVVSAVPFLILFDTKLLRVIRVCLTHTHTKLWLSLITHCLTRLPHSFRSPAHADVFMSASGDTTTRIWDLRTPQPSLTLPAHAFEVRVRESLIIDHSSCTLQPSLTLPAHAFEVRRNSKEACFTQRLHMPCAVNASSDHRFPILAMHRCCQQTGASTTTA